MEESIRTRIQNILRSLTLEEKLGQMFVTGLPGTQIDPEFHRLVKDCKLGNVILFRENARDKKQLKNLCTSLRELISQETGFLPFLTIDEEGGVVSRLSWDLGKMPSAMAFSALKDPSAVYQGAFLCGRQLQALGINFNLAPVLDINSNPQNPVIGVRSFGTTAQEVWECASPAIRGYLDARILCCGKHFPGHGDTQTDSHLALPVISKTLRELESEELIPFQKAIREGIPAITIAHIVFEQEDTLPATMSKKLVRGLLREKMGFEGLILSDCLEMKAISQGYGIAKGAIGAVQAGIDLIFISHWHDEVRAAIRALRQAVSDGEIPMSRIDESAGRILAFKLRLQEAELSSAHREAPVPLKESDALSVESEACGSIYGECRTYADGIYKKAVAASCHGHAPFSLGPAPFFLSPPQSRVSLVSNEAGNFSLARSLWETFGGSFQEIDLSPDEAQRRLILEKAKKSSAIVIGSLNATVYPSQLQLLMELSGLGIPMACLPLRNPFELCQLPENVFGLSLYEYTRRAAETAKDFFVRSDAPA